MSLADFFRREPKSLKGIKDRSGGTPGAEGALPPLKPITGEQARAALKRSRARREANGTA
ncbi:hypothetical protein DVA67_019035 [Solirubrobacter sp. CPCC 204708]|uniref:Histone H1 n=1 Tax=Solirubrobacter deserti TaxID=2282478 RepID=A0ABT4RFR4_9ACTN|nr:hypothetical protein [Solirubrobacter deserti]MBE2318084.1 hypothetical protein [Solirubrobacter deserti]MDA0137362.1 hypothetical protein [Solirubrobacter deserti]